MLACLRILLCLLLFAGSLARARLCVLTMEKYRALAQENSETFERYRPLDERREALQNILSDSAKNFDEKLALAESILRIDDVHSLAEWLPEQLRLKLKAKLKKADFPARKRGESFRAAVLNKAPTTAEEAGTWLVSNLRVLFQLRLAQIVREAHTWPSQGPKQFVSQQLKQVRELEKHAFHWLDKVKELYGEELLESLASQSSVPRGWRQHGRNLSSLFFPFPAAKNPYKKDLVLNREDYEAGASREPRFGLYSQYVVDQYRRVFFTITLVGGAAALFAFQEEIEELREDYGFLPGFLKERFSKEGGDALSAVDLSEERIKTQEGIDRQRDIEKLRAYEEAFEKEEDPKRKEELRKLVERQKKRNAFSQENSQTP